MVFALVADATLEVATSVTDYILGISCSIHGVALFLGALAFMAYNAMTQVFPVPDRRKSAAVELSRTLKGGRAGLAAVGIAAFAAFIALHASGTDPASCPAGLDFDDGLDSSGGFVTLGDPQLQHESGVDAQGIHATHVLGEPETPTQTSSEMPSELIRRAIAASDVGDKLGQRTALQACAVWAWIPNEQGNDPAAPPNELFSQLECYGEMLERLDAGGYELESLVSSSRKLYKVLEKRSEEDIDTWASAQAEWARVSTSAMLKRSSQIADELKKLGKAKPGSVSVVQALASLRKFGALERVFREALSASHVGISILQRASEAGHDVGDDLEELWNTRALLRVRMLRALREARILAPSTPAHSPEVKELLRCSSIHASSRSSKSKAAAPLWSIEGLILEEAHAESDPSATFSLGEYWSERGVAPDKVLPSWRAIFGDTGASTVWVRDAGEGQDSSHVPEEIAKAEELLKLGCDNTVGADVSERAALRSLRLYQHAKFLAQKHHDAAAELRYRLSANVAVEHHRKRLAAHSLARLGYLYTLRGRHSEALVAVEESVALAKDPLAQYLQSVLRRNAGELKNSEDVLAAEVQLNEVAGLLPSKYLEEQRAKSSAELKWWRAAAGGSAKQCFRTQDAANFLVCLLCKMFLPGSPTPVVSLVPSLPKTERTLPQEEDL